MIFVLFFCWALSSGDYAILFGRGRGLLKRLLTERGFASVLCVWRSIYVPCARVLCGSIEWLFLWTRWQRSSYFWKKTLLSPRKKQTKQTQLMLCALVERFFFSLGYGYYAVQSYSSRNTTWRQTISTLILISSLLSTSHSLPIPPLSNQEKISSIIDILKSQSHPLTRRYFSLLVYRRPAGSWAFVCVWNLSPPRSAILHSPTNPE